MSSHVRTVVVGVFSPGKEVIEKELEGQPVSSAADPNLFLKQDKPHCTQILFYPSCPYHFMLAIVLCTYVYDLYENVATL
jgi:hypothetical protein